MKIIVGGAGSVGKSIVSYLVRGNNDIIVIDNNQAHLNEISKEYDIQPILGSVSHPNILEKAGIKNADLLIAVTDDDEVNMVACQVGASIFNVPQKIARIDNENFLSPLWATLYNDKALPIDLIISPDIAIAEAIYRLIKVPGTSEVLPLLGGELHLLAFRCPDNSPLLNTPLTHIERVIDDIDVKFVNIIRDGQNFVPKEDDIIKQNDLIYVLTPTDKIYETIHGFGIEYPANERIIIFGGNQISLYLGQKIEKDDAVINCKIVEEDYNEAKFLAKRLDDISVIQGQMMSDVILSEAGISNADLSVAVTTKDKDNLLASLLARKSGVKLAVSVVNTLSYNNLIDNVGDSLLIDRSSITISALLREIRKVKIDKAYSLGRGFGEIWEVAIDEDSPARGKNISDLKLPTDSQICAVYRNKEVIYPNKDVVLNKDDVLILFVNSPSIKKVEKIFS